MSKQQRLKQRNYLRDWGLTKPQSVIKADKKEVYKTLRRIINE